MKDNELEFNGERLTTGVFEYWSLEHLHRYAIAMSLVQGKKVLDIASGEGYGTHLLSKKALTIVGVDISETAVRYATNKYQKPNLSFRTGSASFIPLEDNSVNVVVSFETIEHHDEHDKMMQEIKRVLAPGGLIIISSPDRKFYSDIPNYRNPYHVKELYAFEFEQLIAKYFSNTVFFKQKTIFGSVISSSINESAQMIEYSGDYSGIGDKSGLQDCPYIVCIASNDSMKDIPINTSVFFNNDMFNLYSKLRDENINLVNSNKLIQQKLNDPLYIIKRIISLPLKSAKKILGKKS
jgi:ubiquinone/menaquinone biosynthesis C-methylase UbiE